MQNASMFPPVILRLVTLDRRECLWNLEKSHDPVVQHCALSYSRVILGTMKHVFYGLEFC